MRATLIAITLVAAGAIQVAAAQEFSLSGNRVAPMGWAATDTALSAAARELDNKFLKGTETPPSFRPETLSSEMEQSLESRLDAGLQRQLEQDTRQTEDSVSAN